MSHTPGPWQVHLEGSVRVCDGAHDSDDGCRTILEAEIIGVPRAEAVANARMGAAAPELLKVACAAWHALKSYQYGNGAPDLARACADALAVAIEQATGAAP